RSEGHLLILTQLVDAILRGDLGCTQRDQEVPTHCECSVTSQGDLLVDIAVCLLAQGRRVENKHKVCVLQLLQDALVPEVSTRKGLLIEPGLEVGRLKDMAHSVR